MVIKDSQIRMMHSSIFEMIHLLNEQNLLDNVQKDINKYD